MKNTSFKYIYERLLIHTEQLDKAFSNDGRDVLQAAYEVGVVRMKLGDLLVEFAQIIEEMEGTEE